MTTATSEKEDKRRAYRVERRTNYQILSATGDADHLKHRRILTNPWDMEKDGKQHFDPREHPRLMRK